MFLKCFYFKFFEKFIRKCLGWGGICFYIKVFVICFLISENKILLESNLIEGIFVLNLIIGFFLFIFC